jgi:hypothetical protein
MAIAIEVAKVSAALRCNRWGNELEGNASRNVIMHSESTLEEFLDNTAAYARLEREKIIKALRTKRQRIK